MRLICLDRDNCGFSQQITPDENHQNTCSICFGVAAIYTDNYNPIIYDTHSSEIAREMDEILAYVHNLITEEINNLKKEDENHRDNNEKQKEP